MCPPPVLLLTFAAAVLVVFVVVAFVDLAYWFVHLAFLASPDVEALTLALAADAQACELGWVSLAVGGRSCLQRHNLFSRDDPDILPKARMPGV